MTIRFDALCRHYGMVATRNNRGRGHENGSIESAHGHLKRRIEQALLLRGNSDFESVMAYQEFIDAIVDQANRRNAKTIDEERKVLLPLPEGSATDYHEQRAVVSSSSTIIVRRVTYTVPSRLQGEVLNVRIYDHQLICYLGAQHTVTLPRLHLQKGKERGRQVDYRHVIQSLIKKPQAFRYSQLRDDLLPDHNYHVIWSSINKVMQPQEACQFIVGLLHLAATNNCEKALGEAVIVVLNKGQKPVLNSLKKQFCQKQDRPHIEIIHHPLETYNLLIPQYSQEVCHHA
jgi:hypothetical protein